jgi:cystathionine beta-lyase/cystathionine gamma-synthase
MNVECRAIMKVGDSLVRVTVGIDEPEDFLGDFEVSIARRGGWEFDSRTR